MVKKIIWEARCPFCGKKSELAISAKGYNAWIGGTVVQKAFPELTADEREVLITGMCLDCQKKIFAEDEDDGDDEDDGSDDRYTLEDLGPNWY